ncbi:hypothetical protein L208DRAFT_1329657 [Tricholoma matsutake]|nr:hypothetical protein L208DRAFT_1329657 [Tricholoma matsutake 945]
MAEKSKNGKVCLPKYAPPEIFDGTIQNTKSFISFIVLYIHRQKPEFCTVESKIMFALSYIQGGKAQAFATFKEFLERLEAQFGDPNPKVMANTKLKMMCQGASTVDKLILQFKAEASQMDMGEAALVEYLKVGLNPSLFKSIY